MHLHIIATYKQILYVFTYNLRIYFTFYPVPPKRLTPFKYIDELKEALVKRMQDEGSKELVTK